ncbi:DUF5939 domain-containing protein [Chloroflexota bacterium]
MSAIQINEQLLDEKFAGLEAVRQWSPRVISKLETMIHTADDYALFRINPVKYASDKGMSENEAIDLFLYGTKVGLFEMEWHLTCAFCAHVVESFRDLTDLYTHFGCKVCSSVNDVALDDYIQVSFTISPQIRDIVFRHPESLSTEDFYLKYYLSKGVLPSSEGQKFEDQLRHLTKLFVDIFSQEKRTVELDLAPGLFQIRDMSNNTSVTFLISDNQDPGMQTVPLKLMDGKFQAVDRTLLPQELIIEPCTLQLEQVGQLSSGKVVIKIENLMEKRSPIWMIHFPPDYIPSYKQFEPFLSGKMLLTTQTFRDLFRSEVVSSSEGIGVQDITFLFTDLKGSTDLYDRIGDLKAYYLVRQHFDTLGRVITQNSGAIVKTIGDAVMATFMNPVDAVKTAIEMLQDIKEFNHNISDDLILKIGIHRGPSIVVTLNDRLDYFGQTVNIAARVQGLAGANEIYVSSDAHNYPGVDEVLEEYEVSPEQANVKGVSEQLDVSKVTVRK